MTDVQEIFYGVASSMTLGTGGTSLVRDNLLMEPIIGIENRGAGRFVLIGDSNVFSDEIAAAYDPGRNGVFARNLCGDNVPPTVTITRPAKNARYKLGANLGLNLLVRGRRRDRASVLRRDACGRRRRPLRHVDRRA